MFKSVLIANRGEIALRIGRTCEKMGIKPLYIYESADQELPHAKAFGSVQINSYMDPEEIIKVSKNNHAEAIHPGYGFISENSEFVRLANEDNIEFVGPSYRAMSVLGNKQVMLRSARIANISRIPGVSLDITNIEGSLKAAENIGYPVIAKGKESAGGRQIKLLQTAEDVEKAILKLQEDGETEEVYIGKFLTNVKHIEVQLVGDKYGNVISLGTRDCSVQRRFQKLIEEAPATISIALRKEIEQAAIEISALVDYVCACTVEFLLDQNQGKFYFMEVNPRLQVEHCVTEEIYNVDIVEQQFCVANGDHLNPLLKEIKPNGHSIQFRINAEDPLNNFLPSAGVLTDFIPPEEKEGQIRFESFLKQNLTIPAIYDSLIAKLIVNGKNRSEALLKITEVLNNLSIEGFPTTIPFFQSILKEKTFLDSRHKTNYLNLYLPDLLSKIKTKT
ncbi:MAG: ATP-binding protein [Candidatus Hodarchaeales archaeon]|jgi:acetyl-CoA carboxylase biotin carboxylase subunit